MNPENSNRRDNDPQKKFEFASEAEMARVALKISEQLTPFLGTDIAKDSADFLLDLAKRINAAIQKLLLENSVNENYDYDGSVFQERNGKAIIFAPNGLKMIENIASRDIGLFFGKQNPIEPVPDVFIEKLKSMFEYVSNSYAEQINRLQNLHSKTGNIKTKFGNLEVLEVLGNHTTEEKTEAMNNILSLQADIKSSTDDFFKKLEKQFGEPHSL